jgi:hypothetical protein
MPALSLQVHQPAHKLAKILQQLLQQQQAAAAVLLLEHLVSGQHPELAAAACRSAELDRAAAGLASTSISSWLLSADPLAPRLLVLLLAGDGNASLLSQAAQAAMLGQLLEQLHIAAAAIGGHDIGEPAAAAAAPAVLQVLQGALLSPALDASSGEVQSLRLQLLAAALNLLLRDAAAEAAAEGAAEESGSEHGASSFVDDSEAESVEIQQQPGAAAVAARLLWQQQQQGAITALVERVPAEQQAAFVGSIQHAVSEVLDQHATPGAAEAAAEVAGLALSVLGPSRQQQLLLQGLLQQRQAAREGEAGSSSAAGSSSRYSTAQAVFLAADGAATGYDALLPSSSPQAAAEAAVDILAGLTDVPTAASVPQRQQLLRYIADAAADVLLQPALQAAAAAAAAASPHHAAVLSSLLHTAVDSHSSASPAAVASFFAAATAGGSGQPQLLPAMLLQVLPLAAPVFRSSEALLQQSCLAELAQRLCQQCTAAEPAALATSVQQQQRAVQLLRTAVACFPCATGAEAAAALPSPAAATAAGQQATAASSSSSSSSYRKGDAVWYCQQGGSWFEAEVGPAAGLLPLASASEAFGQATTSDFSPHSRLLAAT